MIVRYPGHIAPGTVDKTPWAFWDVLPTLAELAGGKSPADIDGISMLPTLLGKKSAGHEQAPHPPFYWEFHEKGFNQATRFGKWKAVRHGVDAPIQLFNLTTDLGERHNIADQHPDVVAQAAKIFASTRTKSDYLPLDQ
jgi:arylsulfatase A